MGSAERDAFDAGRLRVGQASHPKCVEEAEDACEDGDEQGCLKRAVSGLLVDAEELGLNRFGLLGQQGLELGVAHHLGIVLERTEICSCCAGGTTLLSSVRLVNSQARNASMIPPAIARPKESPNDPAAEFTPAA